MEKIFTVRLENRYLTAEEVFNFLNESTYRERYIDSFLSRIGFSREEFLKQFAESDFDSLFRLSSIMLSELGLAVRITYESTDTIFAIVSEDSEYGEDIFIEEE